MRHAITVAAFAAGALAIPYAKPDVVAHVEMVYVTDVVTITAGQAAPTPEVKANKHFGHHNHVSEVVKVAVPEAPAVEVPAPVAEIPAPVVEVPAPKLEATIPVPQPIFEAPSAGAKPTDYASTVVFHHNLHRANHSAPDLEWDEGLASSAATLAASCVYEHNTDIDGGGYGQNIAAGVEGSNISTIITDMFYNNEEPLFAANYGSANPDMSGFSAWGHFSQIVWKSTTSVGCATQHCPGGLGNVGSGVQPYFTVCNYKEPGNFAGRYDANVLAPKGLATVFWDAGLSL